MGVRNCQELGVNLQKIYSRLLNNDNLVNLLYYTGTAPLEQPHLSAEAKEKLFNDLICIVPRLGTREDSRSAIAIYVPKATKISGNKEFKYVTISIDVCVPLEQWIIKDSNLRPFAIMGEIQTALDGKTVNGLGKIEGGDFVLVQITEDVAIYQQTFQIIEYD